MFRRADLVFVTSEKLRAAGGRDSRKRPLLSVRRALPVVRGSAAGDRGSAPADIAALPAADRRLRRRHAPVDRSGPRRRRRAPTAGCDVCVRRAAAVRSVAARSVPEHQAARRQAARELPRYIREFDVGMVPYRLSDYTSNVYPTKLNEYLVDGHAVVATDLPGDPAVQRRPRRRSCAIARDRRRVRRRDRTRRSTAVAAGGGRAPHRGRAVRTAGSRASRGCRP